MGNPFHGEFSSTDASAPGTEPDARVTLYDMLKAAITITATQTVVITDITIVAGSAMTVTIFDGANTTVEAGERIAKGNFAANGGQSSKLATPHFCKVGTYPKVLTSVAGQVDVILHGYVQGV